ncbi:SDR family NAD(P)-dependent oxidoreductase [Rhizobium sp. RCC_161_2]|uniref:type I polyketide synthase n=1 Tax=Rhizobium sp. RCC_161_2 TaxID=3239219 RepID=UPI003524EE1A
MNVLAREVSIENTTEDVEPIAVVGMSCRFPGDADTPEKFWELLVERRVTVGELPAKRWDAYNSASPKIAAALSSATRLGSFLTDIEGFDADFFGMSAREAEFVDPQQRVVLELSWEALERAGIPPSSLKGTDVGVYVAANSFDFGHRLMSNLAEIQPWTMNGSMLFGIANRVSYVLDLRGPSMVVDTACAGSLTVLHLACQALWRNEVPLAIVGGVNIMSNPGMMLALDAAGATAKDGRSKAFDRSANGYGRGEGAGLVVLKRLSDATRSKDHILAVVRGGGIFQDGRTAGMMAPNPEAQEAMLRKTYERFGITPSSVSYVEAHGTGTQAGDKAEISALSRVFGENREGPCLIGSAKPNIGHLEAGAGIVGLIKAVLSLQTGTIPPSVHSELNDEINWVEANLRVVSEPTPWPSDVSPRRVGVSCFGVGGVISHTIVEEAPTVPRDAAAPSLPTIAEPGLKVFPISGRSHASLQSNASKLVRWISDNPDTDLTSIGYTLSRRRDHLNKRAVIIASSIESWMEGLSAIAEGEEGPDVVRGETSGETKAGPVWVFSGHGAQWEGMARELLSENPVFAGAIDSLAPIFQRELGYSARDALLESDWSTVERVQALTFAVQVALSEVWNSLGLYPGAVIGHSVGEIAAAVASGALEVDHAAVFACRRAGIYQRLAGNGSMAMARIPFEEAEARLSGNTSVVAAIAASPNATVISGDSDELDQILSAWKKERIVVRKVGTIDAAFHSPQIDPLLDDIRAAAAHLRTGRPRIPLYTTTLDDPRSVDDRGEDFWAINSRGAVQLVNAVNAALEDGFTAFLEVSSAPIVAPSIRETVDVAGRDEVAVLATLAPNKPEMMSMLASLSTLFSVGHDIDWAQIHQIGNLIELPTQSWQHRTFWPSTNVSSGARSGGHAPGSHTLLGQPEHVRSSPPAIVWRTELEYSTRPYPGSHPLFGVEIVPAAALLYSLMTAAGQNGELGELSDIALRTPIPVDSPLEVQIVRQGETISISTRRKDVDNESAWSWTTHTVARVEDIERDAIPTARLDISKEQQGEFWSWEKVEELYKRRGIGGYGFPWKMLELHRREHEIWASFAPEADERTRTAHDWAEVLDAALTICPLLLPDDALLRMPSRISKVIAIGMPPANYSVRVTRHADTPSSEDCLLCVEIIGESGHIVGSMEGVLFGVLDGVRDFTSRTTDIVFAETWLQLPVGDLNAPTPRKIVFVGSDDQCPQSLVEALQQADVDFQFVDSASAIPSGAELYVVVHGSPPRPGEALEVAAERNAWILIDTAQRLLLDASEFEHARLLCVTSGVRSGDTEGALAQAPMWGIARIVAGERPDLWAGTFDLQPEALDVESAHRLLRAFGSGANEDVINIDDGSLWALRLVPASSEQGNGRTRRPGWMECRSNATYLITGGLGALGLEAARYLVSRGARRIVLASRRQLPPRSDWDSVNDLAERTIVDNILEIEESGATVLPISMDVADPSSVESNLATLANSLPPIKGIVHAAGIFDGGTIGEVEKASLSEAFGAKVGGAANLHRLFPPGSLDFFVQFSSSGQIARLTGQACYAAANSFLDSLAKFRNSSSCADSISLGWMAWRGLGMSKSIDATMVEARGRGLEAIEREAALKAWRYCEDLNLSYAAIFTPTADIYSADLPVLSELTAGQDDEPTTGEAPLDIPADNRFEWLIGDIRRLVSIELKADENNLEVKRPLVDMGVDSLMTVSLRVKLRKRYGFEFPPTLLWNSPSVYAIAQFVDKALQSDMVFESA